MGSQTRVYDHSKTLPILQSAVSQAQGLQHCCRLNAGTDMEIRIVLNKTFEMSLEKKNLRYV